VKSSAPAPDPKARLFRLLAILLVVVVAESVAIGILWRRWQQATGPQDFGLPKGNFIQRAYPELDFSRVYPGLSPAEIDRVQREAFELPYGFEPFTGFRLMPAKRNTVEVTAAGFRAGPEQQPWPPAAEAVSVFVFGGSTTFGYAVGTEDTLCVALQRELRALVTNRPVHCYNFGCGGYFSTQERLRFEQLLTAGHVPRVAVFVDGLNDFTFWQGWPMFSGPVARLFRPGDTLPPQGAVPPGETASTVNSVLRRYQANVRMIEAVAARWQVQPLFIAQPVPFFDFPISPATYPFKTVRAGHELCPEGYLVFEQLTLTGAFGPAAIWCGDAFAQAKAIMYADSIHYSPEGNRVLARLIVQRAKAQGLLKF
jgi:lysophospholipase L1-like esterase